jgi:tetratricopeptide (TPR) repeat protein
LAKVAVDDEAAALSLFNQGLAAYDTFVPLLLARGELHLRGGDFEAARDDLSAAVDLTPRGSAQQVQAYLDLAETFMALELPDDAANMYRAVLRLDPTHHAALVGLGYAQIALGRYGDAGLSFTEALTAAVTDAERAAALLGRALAREAAGQADAAVADLLAVLALTPQRPFQATAEAHLTAIGPLPTGTATRGPSPTPSATATRTPRPTRTPAAPTRTPTP